MKLNCCKWFGWAVLIGAAIAVWWQPWFAFVVGIAALTLADERHLASEDAKDRRDQRATDIEQFDKRIAHIERTMEELRTTQGQMVNAISGRGGRP